MAKKEPQTETAEVRDIRGEVEFHAHKNLIKLMGSFMGANGIRLDGATGLFTSSAGTLTAVEQAGIINAGLKVSNRRIGRQLVADILNFMAKQAATDARDEVVESLVFDPELTAAEPVKNWLLPLCDRPVTDLEVAVVQHWIWNVKRTMTGRPRAWELIPIFYSKTQGTGKTTAIRHILEPLGGYATTQLLQILFKQFDSAVLGRLYVAFFDELSGIENLNVEAFKQMLDSPTVPGRVIFTDATPAAPRLSSFIATTNKPPPHGFVDPTGNRRIFSIHTSEMMIAGERARLLREVRPLDLWRSIDPTANSPLNPFYLEWQKVIEKSRPKSIFAECAEDLLMGLRDEMQWNVFMSILTDYLRQRNLKTRLPAHWKLRQELETVGIRMVNRHGLWFILPADQWATAPLTVPSE